MGLCQSMNNIIDELKYESQNTQFEENLTKENTIMTDESKLASFEKFDIQESI